MTTNSILVLGATGKTGSRVAAQLRRRELPVRAAARHGQTRFDWADDRTWAPALDGVQAAYLVDSQGADAAAALGAFSELAVASGVERLVLLSARDWAVSGGEESLAAERAVQRSGGAWTILRPTWFAQNFSESQFLRDPVLAGEVVIPAGDGLEPLIDADDIAAVAVAALTEDGHAGQIYELSGPRLLSFGAAVAEIASATGREIRYRAATPDAFAAHALGLDTPREHVEILTTLYGWIAEGRNAHLSDGVQRVLGREPRDFTDYVKATTAGGGWNGVAHDAPRTRFVGQEVRLVSRPVGKPSLDDLALVRAEVPEPADGQILVRNTWMSVDPYMRGRMDDVPSYIAPFELGSALEGSAVGEVVASRSDAVAVGATVSHFLGWREYAVAGRGRRDRRRHRDRAARRTSARWARPA